jgi:hypothetical protein
MPNNSKEAPTNSSWPEKIRGRKMTKSGRNEAEKYLYTYLAEKSYNYL